MVIKYREVLERWISGQWLLMFLIGSGTTALIVLGSALMALIGDLITPLFLVLLSITLITFCSLFGVNTAAKQVSRTLFNSPLDLLTYTQKALLTRSQTDTSLGLLLLAIRLESKERVLEILYPLNQDFGTSFLISWLDRVSLEHLSEQESKWLQDTICGSDTVAIFIDAKADEAHINN